MATGRFSRRTAPLPGSLDLALQRGPALYSCLWLFVCCSSGATVPFVHTPFPGPSPTPQIWVPFAPPKRRGHPLRQTPGGLGGPGSWGCGGTPIIELRTWESVGVSNVDEVFWTLLVPGAHFFALVHVLSQPL